MQLSRRLCFRSPKCLLNLSLILRCSEFCLCTGKPGGEIIGTRALRFPARLGPVSPAAHCCQLHRRQRGVMRVSWMLCMPPALLPPPRRPETHQPAPALPRGICLAELRRISFSLRLRDLRSRQLVP